MLTPDVNKMYKVWEDMIHSERNPTAMPDLDFAEIVSSVFSLGPSYHYIIDFYDLNVSKISAAFETIHGQSPDTIQTINDILLLIHPEDMDFVAEAEKNSFNLVKETIGIENITRYKFSYNFRFKVADGGYRLFNHQSLVLTVDDNNNFVKSLNIHTDISHLTSVNNKKVSLIGIGDSSSFLNIDLSRSYANAPLVSPSEMKVLRLIYKGMSSKEIADQLCISIHTVRTHRKNMLEKCNCNSSTALINKAVSEGWI
ncbi:LuxR C-terminal-related transcriptional regulator [Robertkochia solimangrovi]|uniref:LuxR C-terminal-related transcriptional regulator n=1 Tax=Robertkochia solimangrovi TaxID=2213046 RepID=UPI00117D8E7E|nr:LuxR C-terminal-related transcriptional regulator [Robertkochia solimangrovi]TRZ42160.1 helix-turn-helix transcriptional regulator [Robertkochia solimangrovi]